MDTEGAVQLSISYTPWGDTLEVYGSGMLNLGYMGGVYDAGTGLIYMGNGQYYDPSTGRFLTRGANADQSDPYVPWGSDPSGMLITPLLILGLVFGRKKNRNKFDKLIISLIMVSTLGAILAVNIPVKAQSYLSTTSNKSLTMPWGYATISFGGTSNKDIAPNPGSGVKTFRFAVICNEEQNSPSQTILFGGSSGNISEPGPEVELQIPAWLVDGDGNIIPKDQLIRYDGNKVRTAIFADKEKLLPDQSVILIGYSAGTESALIYARLRLEKGQMVDTIVLLGPTFEARIDGDILFPTGNGQTLFVFGDSNERGRELNDWWDYFDYFQCQGVNILVIDDGFGRKIKDAYDINDARNYIPPENAKGDFDYWLNSITWRQHYNTFSWKHPLTLRKGTNRSDSLKDAVYDWINIH